MNLPPFLADDLPDQGRTRYPARPFALHDDAIVLPARRDSTQQGFADCVSECDPTDAVCVTSCKKQWFPTSSGPPGTPPALEACCMAELAICVAMNVATSSYVGLLGCAAAAMSCTTSPTSLCARRFG